MILHPGVQKIYVVFFAIFYLIGSITADPQSVYSFQATPSVSQESRAIAFYPEESGPGTFITVEARRGESATFTVVLGNAGNVDQAIRTYPVPAQSAPGGGFLVDTQKSTPDDQTRWLDYPDQTFDLKPGDGVAIKGVVSVPSDALPGEYVTSLVAEQAEPFEIEGEPLLSQVITWPLAVMIVVPGDLYPQFEVSSAQLNAGSNVLQATINIENTGNAIVRPSGEVRLLDAAGSTMAVGEVRLDSIYTGTSTYFIVTWPNIPASDSYSLKVTLQSEDHATPQVEQVFENVPVSGTSIDSDEQPSLMFTSSVLSSQTDENPPSTLQFVGNIANAGDPIENARISIVTYQDGVEVDRYPIMQAVTIQTGETPVEARYSLPGGFTDGTYTFEITIELGSGDTQTVLATQKIDYEVVVGD